MDFSTTTLDVRKNVQDDIDQDVTLEEEEPLPPLPFRGVLTDEWVTFICPVSKSLL